MRTDENLERDAYLWDPAAKRSAEVQAVQRRIASARFNAPLRPLILPATSRRRNLYRLSLLALAATLALVTVGAAVSAWSVTIERGSSPTRSAIALRPNQPLQLDARASAQGAIPRIGTMRLAPRSDDVVLETTSKRHRVLLNRGAANVPVWAPPDGSRFERRRQT